ncbi:MAG TPA: site-specific integrase [Verrucomicrobiae bacterium]|nr:site-specific integrase [Verrucomicrobiae bacterium]
MLKSASERAATPGLPRPRRGRGSGSVRQRPDGLWEARLDRGRVEGKRRQSSFYGNTRCEVETKLRDAQHSLARGHAPAPAATSLEGYLKGWLANAERRLRPSTLRRYRAVVQYQLIPLLGGATLTQLQPSDVERMLAGLRAQGKAPDTSATVRSVLRAALSSAERDGLVPRNAAKLARFDKPRKPHPAVLTPKAVAAVLDACEPGLRRLVTIACDTGLRQGEELGLRWQDLDFEGRRLWVRTTLHRVGDAYLLGRPTSETSEREVALSEFTLRALRDERAAQAAAKRAAGSRWREAIPGLIFTTRVGAPRNGSSVTHGLQKALASAGLRQLRWHDLRVIHGGLLVQAGVRMSVARDRLGHSSIAVTSHFYSGVVDALQREAADKVGHLLAG